MMVPKPKNYCRCGCGEEIAATRKWVSGHNLKRRPKNAVVKNGRSFVEIKCSECSDKFLRRTDQINRYAVNLCSSECRSSYQSRTRRGKKLPNARTGEYKKCIQCKEDFYVARSRIINENPKYCSKKCLFERQKERGTVHPNFIKSVNNKGKNNGMYKTGEYKRNGRPSKIKLRKKVIERDGGDWCLFCGKPGPGLHLHRIIYGSQGGKYELDNCVQLCAEHHGLVHSNKKKWMPILLDHIENGTIKKGVDGL